MKKKGFQAGLRSYTDPTILCQSIKTKINGIDKEVLFKFFLCKTGDDFDGYWLCVTEDLTNPEPTKVLDTDIERYYNQCEIVKFE